MITNYEYHDINKKCAREKLLKKRQLNTIQVEK